MRTIQGRVLRLGECFAFIFDRFIEVKDIEGNGLRLAIVKTILEQPSSDKGSCFTSTLLTSQ